MKIIEKIRLLESNYSSQWYDTRRVVDNEMSDTQSLFCVCGRLATGLHERHCKRFNSKVNSETVKRLAHFLPTPLSAIKLKGGSDE